MPNMDFSALDRALVRLYMAGCCHKWDQLPELARKLYACGATAEQLRGCVRHLVVFAGYGPCLAATLTLHKAKLLPEDTPAKVSGPPGDAFELVYGSVADRVRANMHAADPALGEWIRLHLYGDVYSSPGLDLRAKQTLTCAFLAEAAMPDQLFGHALAALRFGASLAALQEAAQLACEAGRREPGDQQAVLGSALKTLDMAYAKFCKDTAGQPPSCPEVTIPEAQQHVRIPPLPPLVNASPRAQPDQQEGEKQQQMQPAQALQQSSGDDGHVTIKACAASSASKATGSWGSSNLTRPINLAVDSIAARIEQQRACSGLFGAWPAQQEQDDQEQQLQQQADGGDQLPPAHGVLQGR